MPGDDDSAGVSETWESSDSVNAEPEKQEDPHPSSLWTPEELQVRFPTSCARYLTASRRSI